jgi:hypothetical protein
MNRPGRRHAHSSNPGGLAKAGERNFRSGIKDLYVAVADETVGSLWAGNRALRLLRATTQPVMGTV